MPTEVEIVTKYKELHDQLSTSYYNGDGGLTKEEFDLQHGKIWTDMEVELIVGGYIKIPEPVMDYKAEILKLKAGQDEIKEKLNLLLEKQGGKNL